MEAEKWKSTALLVIDMQKDFIDEDGLLRVDGGKAIVPNVIRAVEVARRRGSLVTWVNHEVHVYEAPFSVIVSVLKYPINPPIVIRAVEVARRHGALVTWVVREHDSQGRDVELFRRHLYTVGKVGPTAKGSVGAELADGLAIKEGEYKVVKTRFSAFFATHLHSVLQGSGINSLVIVGVQTPNCIRQTVFDAVALDYPSVTVIVDATAAATPEIHYANIFDMKNVGVATPTLEEWSEFDT